MTFDTNINVFYSSNTIIGSFLNGEYLNGDYYLTSNQLNMIEDSTTWYVGQTNNGENYKLAKYIDEMMSNTTASTQAKVGLLRIGELMGGQFNKYENNIGYWLLTMRVSPAYVRNIEDTNYSLYYWANEVILGIKPSVNLKSNVIITGGTGLKNDPFTIELAT